MSVQKLQIVSDPLARRRRVPPQPLFGSPRRVSIVIPCYNYARYLPAAVGSALNQTGVAVEIIIVDDASTDESLAVARRLAHSDSRIRIVAHRSNQGPVVSFNDGLARARGEYLVRLDADDLLTPGALQRAIALAQRFPSIGLVYGHPLHFSGSEMPTPRAQATSWVIWPGQHWLSECCRVGSNVITSPEVVMRMSVVRQVGGQMPLAHSHDMEMWLRIAAFSDVGYVAGADQAWHREHSASLSARQVDRYRELCERKEAFETLFAGPAGRIVGAGKLKEVALHAIACEALAFAASDYDRGRSCAPEIERYFTLAGECTADARRVPGWRTLHWRLQHEPKLSARHPFFFAQRLLRRFRADLRWHRWHRSGMF